MAITDSILKLQGEEEEEAKLPQLPPQDSWVKELIDKRYQPKTERLKRSPVGFDFQRDPFDPSSYYKQLGSYRDISRLATEVTKIEAQNKENARLQAEYEASQAAAQNATSGIDANYTYSGATRNYGLKGVTSNVAKAANYFGSKYGIKTIGGKGPGSVPGSDHPRGRALDYMINNIKNGKAAGNALANDLIKNAKAWNVKYIIWNRYIWHPGRGWKKYSGPSAHTDHVHASFNR